MKKTKVVVVMPAHNAAKTLIKAYRRLPHRFIHEVILVDDASNDRTVEIAKQLPIKVYRNPINLGYGGNLKVCLSLALKHQADIVIEYHPDNQYDPASLPEFLEKARTGVDFALGSRFIHPKEALERKMPLVKFVANRALSFIDQFILGIELSEFHSGFRLYTRRLLQNLPYMNNSDNYLFSFEIIVQAVYFKFRIAEIQIACDYHPQMHTANLKHSSIYALGTFKTLWQYVRAKFFKSPTGPFLPVPRIKCLLCQKSITAPYVKVRDAVSGKLFSVIYCTLCAAGFTYPRLTDLSAYYPTAYYSRIKTWVYRIFQTRRVNLFTRYVTEGKVVDIGCGEGSFGDQLTSDKYQYTGIETPFSRVNNPRIKLVGIEGMQEKSNSADAATFWESFEHLRDPLAALRKTHKLLKSTGYLFIECPDFSSWERWLFGNTWFHLDPPRHMYHYSRRGLNKLLTQEGFEIQEHRAVYAPEYIPVGFAHSLLYRLSPRLNLFAQKPDSINFYFLAGTILILALASWPLTYLLYLAGSSPIQILAARKKKKPAA